MPEFIMPFDGPDSIKAFKKLPYMTQGYIEAMFFTSTGNTEDEELEHATFGDLAPETLAKIEFDCEVFNQRISPIIDTPEFAEAAEAKGYDSEALGRDFWYTRCGHGVGFWSRSGSEAFKAVMSRLDELAKSYRSLDLYMGDDGKAYLA